VFEEVRKSGAARPLIERTYVIPQVDSHQRQPVVLVGKDGESVGQRVFLILDFRQLVWTLGNAGLPYDP
jgi:hypothetical protein